MEKMQIALGVVVGMFGILLIIYLIYQCCQIEFPKILMLLIPCSAGCLELGYLLIKKAKE